jgi:hypothetical protein
VQERLREIETNGPSGDRSQFIADCYQNGGKSFVETVRRYGCNERGEALNLSPWFLEYLEAIADFRIQHVYISGCSQVGKTLGATLLLCYCITEGRLNTLWSYDQLGSLRIQVKSNFRPTMRHWLQRKGIELTSKDSDELSLFQLNGADCQFTYVSTSEIKAGRGTAAAGGIAVGVSRDLLIKEERSQYAPGAGDPLNRRLDAGRLPSRPIRELGTPGAGLGIESEIERADYQFEPHCCCGKCKSIVRMAAKGALLRSVEQLVHGEKKQVYLSESGRPIDWFHMDINKSIESAYFGCPDCGAELTNESRADAWFQCIKTGVTLRDMLRSLPPGLPTKSTSLGILLSPLLRIEATNTASAIIREGLDCANTLDWQQQRLGIPSETGTTAITLDMLRRALAAPYPVTKPDVTIAGIDQGRGQYWLWVADMHMPPDWSVLSIEQIIERTVQVVRFGGDVMVHEVANKLKAYDVKFGLIDNEPERREASELARITCLQLADQKAGQIDDIRKTTVLSGGVEYDCWAIANERFLKQVLNTFTLSDILGYPLQRLPNEWERWIGVNSEMSPLRHLSGPRHDPHTGKWERGDNGVDDVYYACMFAQAAFYLWLSRSHKKDKVAYRPGALGTVKPR